jgi:hypothetical protein
VKKILLFLIIVFELTFIPGCDPDRNIGGTFHFNLQGTLNNTSGTINLGDTIKFEVKMPSSITATTLDGASKTETVNSLQRAFYGFHLFRIDTINHKAYSYTGDSMKINYYLSPGYQMNPCQPCYGGYAYLQNSSPPYMCILHIIPQVKGVFVFQIDLQEGNFKINNNFEGLFSVKIDVPDMHLGLVDTYIPGYANGIVQAGMSVYCFRVN